MGFIDEMEKLLFSIFKTSSISFLYVFRPKVCYVVYSFVVGYTEKARKEIALGPFIDIEGTFGNTSLTSLKRATERRNFRPVIW